MRRSLSNLVLLERETQAGETSILKINLTRICNLAFHGILD